MIVRKNSVLLLNADYTFLSTINLKRSLKLYCRGKAKVLESNNKFVHPSLDICEPKVMILKTYRHIPYKFRKIKLSRESLILRDNGQCQYSGRKLKRSEIEIDHVIPRSKGGKNTWENLVVASPEMNSLKGNRTPKEAGLELIKQPKEPTVFDLLKNAQKDDWSRYLG